MQLVLYNYVNSFFLCVKLLEEWLSNIESQSLSLYTKQDLHSNEIPDVGQEVI